MLARIYRPARSAMQSGPRQREWILEFVPAETKSLDPLMGWTGSGDMDGQVQLRFESRDEAIAYAERNGIPYQTFEPKTRRQVLRQNGYGDNFAAQRRVAWTH